jgi:3-keto-disaccharide hydrolase
MKKQTLACWICTLLTLCFSVRIAAGADEAEKVITPTDAPIVLFNGKDLTNFYTWLQDTKREDPRKVFTVTKEADGTPVIRASGDGFGGIVTKDKYSNYHLVVEYRWGELTWGQRKMAAKDSGVLLHCNGDDGNYNEGGGNSPWMAGIECQIIEGGVGDFLVLGGTDNDGTKRVPKLTCEFVKDRDGEAVWKKGGEKKAFTSGRINWYGRDPDWKDELGIRFEQDKDSPGQEWTRLECICDGGKITNIVNGTVVNYGEMAEPESGKLMFQSEGAEIFFRKIELHPLKKE